MRVHEAHARPIFSEMLLLNLSFYPKKKDHPLSRMVCTTRGSRNYNLMTLVVTLSVPWRTSTIYVPATSLFPNLYV